MEYAQACVYGLLGNENEIFYIGATGNINTRMNAHRYIYKGVNDHRYMIFKWCENYGMANKIMLKFC